MANKINSISIKGRNFISPPYGINTPNIFKTQTGASNPGIGQFLVQDFSEVKIDADEPVIKKLKLESYNQADAITGLSRVNINVIEAGLITKRADLISDKNNYGELQVVDLRHQLQTPITKHYNVQDRDRTALILETLKEISPGSYSEWLWDEVIDDLGGIVVHESVTLPEWLPRNLKFDSIPKCRAIDEIAAQLYLVAAWDYDNDQVVLYNPGYMLDSNKKLLEKHKPINKLENTPVTRFADKLPSEIVVSFRRIEPDIGIDKEAQWVEFEREVVFPDEIKNSTRASGKIELQMANYFAIVDSSDTVINQDELQTVAYDIADRAANLMLQEIDEIKFPGLIPFKLDGKVRSIAYKHTAAQSWTIITYNNVHDFRLYDPIVDNNQLAYNYEYNGLGLDVASSPSGSRIISNVERYVRWGKATADWTAGNTVTLYPTDSSGNRIFDSPNVTAYIVTPTSETPGTPDININDVLAYLPYGYDKGVLVNPKFTSSGGVLLGIATADWVEADENESFVVVNPVTARDGSGQDHGTDVTVYLYRSYDGSTTDTIKAQDPNVREGQVIAYMLDPNGDAFAVSGYLDDPIGTIKVWTDSVETPAGWYVCDGDNGTLDLRGRFIVGWYPGGLPALSFLGMKDDYATVGDDTQPSIGGTAWHGAGCYELDNGEDDANNHPDHPRDVIDGSGPWTLSLGTCHRLDHLGIYNEETLDDGTTTTVDTENRPPFVTIIYIQRVD